MLVTAGTETIDGPIRRLRVAVRIETTEYILKADEMDYNEVTGDVDARGNVYYKNLLSLEEFNAEKVKYNLEQETGQFFSVSGSSLAKVDYRPGVLRSDNPYYFQGDWMDKLKDRYILHQGFLTNCRIGRPRPLSWRLYGSSFDIIPGRRAIAKDALMRIRKVPILYLPAFYKSLEEAPRRSGFLTPNIGRSSRRGYMLGAGYYWAINRSFDTMYRAQWFTQRGFAHEVNFRGKPNEVTDFNFYLYGVNDRGRLTDSGDRVKEGGYSIFGTFVTKLRGGWEAKANINYLSSYLFRQAFTQSFNEAIFSEVNSTGYLSKNWSYYSLTASGSRHQLFLSTTPDDVISIRRLPSVDFAVREKPFLKDLPLYFSMESSVGLLKRREPAFITRQFNDRVHFSPHVTGYFHLAGFDISPSVGVLATHYGSRRSPDNTGSIGDRLMRAATDISVDILPPSLQKLMNVPRFLGGGKAKHVIEPRLSYRKVSGIADFSRIIRYDETDIFANTNEAEISLTNRLFTKRANGETVETLSWQVFHRRYFDPTFGGALADGQRNVFATTSSLSGYAFLDRARRYSPVVNVLRWQPVASVGLDWRVDVDPLVNRVTNSTFTGDFRRGLFSAGGGHNQVRGLPAVSPNANQFLFRSGWGNESRQGWSVGTNGVYDYRDKKLQYATTQITYNTDCCGVSMQWRRFSFGTRNENLFFFSLAIANIGSFGTLRRQERLF